MRNKSCLVFAIAFASACGDEGVSIDADEDNVCAEIAEVACHNLYQCCAEGEIEDFLGVSEPRTEVQCRDDVRKLCDRQLAFRAFSIAEGRSSFDSATMNTCLEALVAPDGVCAEIADALPWTIACMNDAWFGKVADGGECFEEFECSGADSFCAPNQLCTALPGQGQPCQGACATGLFCSAGTCQPQVGEGANCTSSQQCQMDLFCDFNQAIPKCTRRGEGGAPCTGDQTCESFDCIPGQCAGQFANSCFEDNDCNDHCADDGSFCSQDANCQIGQCSVTTTTSCSVTGQCPVGETCVLPVQCLPADCTGNPVCTAARIVVDYCDGALSELPIP